MSPLGPPKGRVLGGQRMALGSREEPCTQGETSIPEQGGMYVYQVHIDGAPKFSRMRICIDFPIQALKQKKAHLFSFLGWYHLRMSEYLGEVLKARPVFALPPWLLTMIERLQMTNCSFFCLRRSLGCMACCDCTS